MGWRLQKLRVALFAVLHIRPCDTAMLDRPGYSEQLRSDINDVAAVAQLVRAAES
jgi:hypothetical protein